MQVFATIELRLFDTPRKDGNHFTNVYRGRSPGPNQQATNGQDQLEGSSTPNGSSQYTEGYRRAHVKTLQKNRGGSFNWQGQPNDKLQRNLGSQLATNVTNCHERTTEVIESFVPIRTIRGKLRQADSQPSRCNGQLAPLKDS